MIPRNSLRPLAELHPDAKPEDALLRAWREFFKKEAR